MNKEWDYRVVRKESENGSDEWYSIQEIYYDDSGKPYAQTIDLMIEGDTVTGMRTQLEKMIECLKQPMLDEIQDASVPFPTSDDGIFDRWDVFILVIYYFFI